MPLPVADRAEGGPGSLTTAFHGPHSSRQPEGRAPTLCEGQDRVSGPVSGS